MWIVRIVATTARQAVWLEANVCDSAQVGHHPDGIGAAMASAAEFL